MPGKQLQNFADFMTVTPDRWAGGTKGVINEAAKHSWVIDRLMLGQDAKEAFSTGNYAKVPIMWDEQNTADFYVPGETVSFENPQVIDEVKVPLKYVMDHIGWTDQEILQNEGMTDSARWTEWIRLKYIKQMRMWTSLLHKIDDRFLASVHGTTQYNRTEGTNGKYPHSLFSFLTEDASAYHPQGWTTIMTEDPASQDGWRNPVETYDYDDRDDSNEEGDGLIRAFDNMQLQLKFDLPGTRNEYFEKPNMRRQFILTSKEGLNNYKDLLRAGNDRTLRPTDYAMPSVQYANIDIMYKSDMDTVALYDQGGTGGIGGVAGTWTTYEDEADATYNGPRYVWVNGNYIHMIFHPARYFTPGEVIRPQQQMDTNVQTYTSWYQLICKSRRRGGGFISPKA